MYMSGKFSDALICCNGREFPVHRAVVCPQSDFLAAAFDGAFKESQTRKLQLTDEDPNTVERMLFYLYTGDYDDGRSTVLQRTSENKLNYESSAQSDKLIQLRFPHLALPSSKLQKNVLLNNTYVYLLADKFRILKLKEHAKAKYIDYFAIDGCLDELLATITFVYESTSADDRSLRDFVSQTCAEHRKELIVQEDFRNICNEVGSFAFDFMSEVFKTQDAKIQVLVDARNESQSLLDAKMASMSQGIAYDEDIGVYSD